MNNKLLLLTVLLIIATASQAEYTRITDNYFPADNAFSYPSVGMLIASKDAHPDMVRAYADQIHTDILTQKIFVGAITTMFTGIVSCTLASWYQDYKVLCAKKRKEIARLHIDTRRISARG